MAPSQIDLSWLLSVAPYFGFLKPGLYGQLYRALDVSTVNNVQYAIQIRSIRWNRQCGIFQDHETFRSRISCVVVNWPQEGYLDGSGTLAFCHFGG